MYTPSKEIILYCSEFHKLATLIRCLFSLSIGRKKPNANEDPLSLYVSNIVKTTKIEELQALFPASTNVTKPAKAK